MLSLRWSVALNRGRCGMTSRFLAIPIMWLPLLLSPDVPGLDGTSAAPPRHLTVTITSTGYSPSTLTVRHGDVVRFVQQHAWAHNIEFHRAPRGAGFSSKYQAPEGDIEVLRSTSPTARVGPMLIGLGRVYEVRIGEEMPAGEYVFGCSRHSKWRGHLVVDDAPSRP